MGNVLTSIQFPQQEKKSEQTSEFLKAAFAGATESIILMIENGQSVNCADKYGLTGFHWAAFTGRLGVIKVLLEHGAVPSCQDMCQRTPLHHAAHKGQIEIVDYLLDTCNIDINAKSAKGDTALHKAVRAGYLDVTDALLQFGADPNAINYERKSPFHEAWEVVHVDEAAKTTAASTSKNRHRQSMHFLFQKSLEAKKTSLAEIDDIDSLMDSIPIAKRRSGRAMLQIAGKKVLQFVRKSGASQDMLNLLTTYGGS